MPWSKETMFLSCCWVLWLTGKSLEFWAWLWRSGCYLCKTLSILQLCAQCLGLWIEATMAVTLFSYKHSCCSYVNDHVHGQVAWEIPSLGPCSALGKKGGKIGERSESRGYVWRGKTNLVPRALFPKPGKSALWTRLGKDHLPRPPLGSLRSPIFFPIGPFPPPQSLVPG